MNEEMNEQIEANEQVEAVEKPKRTRRKQNTQQEPATVEDAKESSPEAPEEASKGTNEVAMNPYKAKVICALLNVRERPEKASDVARTVRHNESLVIIDHCDNWGKLENGGYVMLEFIERIDD